MCEECSHFLEIAEAIKSLGLTILKGVTEAHGEKTWICFVVEVGSQGSESFVMRFVIFSNLNIFPSINFKKASFLLKQISVVQNIMGVYSQKKKKKESHGG